jgi:hypothetical protein
MPHLEAAARANDLTVTSWVEAQGVIGRTWVRWKAQGYIPEGKADELASALGLHLDIVWGTSSVVPPPDEEAA